MRKIYFLLASVLVLSAANIESQTVANYSFARTTVNTNSIVLKYTGSAWAATTTGTGTSTTTQLINETGFGDFAIGENSGSVTVSGHSPNSTICAGSNTSFTATSSSTPPPTVQWERSTNGTIWVPIDIITDGGVYSTFTTTTLNITGATVSMTGYQYRAVFTNINGTATSNPATLTVTATSNAGTVSGSTPLCIGNTATYTTNGLSGGTWSSTSPGVATVNASTGLVTAVAAGFTDITYTSNTGCGPSSAASQTLTVNPNANAGTISGTSPLCIGVTSAYTTNGDVGGTWSSNNISVATVNFTTGAVTALSAGSANIIYTVSSGCTAPVSSFKTLTVNVNANAGTVSGTSLMCIGNNATYTTTGDGGGAWSSSDGAVATVNSSTGVVHAVAFGSANIIYAVTGCNGPAAASRMVVVSPVITAGNISGATPICRLVSTAYTSDGTTGGTWTSTNIAVATVVGATGVVTGVSAGTSDITYTVISPCGLTASNFKTLTVSPDANPGSVIGSSPLCIGSSTTYASTGEAGGTWSSSDNTVAIVVSLTGAVTTTGAGTATITYTLNTGCNAPKTSNKTITVSANGIWLGVNNNWTDGSNWCGGVAPTAVTEVMIPTGLTNYPVVSLGIVNANDVTIASGASFTVNGTGILILHGAISNNGTLNMSAGTLELAGSGTQTLSGASLQNRLLKDLIISNNSNLSSTANDTLKLTGFLSFGNVNNKTFTTNGNLTLISNAAGTASVKDITNNTTVTGNSISGDASVERYIPAGRKFRFISVNTLGGPLTVQNSWMEGQTPGANAGPANYGLWITGNPATGFDAFTSTPTIKWWDGTIYTGIINPTTYDLRSHTSYMVFVRGDRSAIGGGNANITPTVLRTTGALSQGNSIGQTTVATGTASIAITNPYPSAIDLTKLTYSDNGDSTINIKIWDPNLAGAYSLGGFQTLTKAPGALNFTITPGGGSYGAATTLNSVESGQAFFMQGSGLSRDISFREPAKTPKANDVFRLATQDQTLRGTLFNKDSANATTVADGIMVMFGANYNTAADPNDARKLPNGNENVAVKRDGELMTVEFRNVLAAEDTVKLNISGMRVKDYQWTFTLSNIDEPGRVGYLKDKYLGTGTLLDLNGINIANFSVTSNAASFATDRFMIIFKPANVLPVTITTISANRRTDGNIDVKWQAENEMNIDYYETERSGDGRTFRRLGNTAPANNAGGSAAYVYTDVNPLNTDNYYRIRAIGTDGSIHQTGIVKVNAIMNEGMITVYPNLIRGTTVAVHFENKSSGKYGLQVINKAGQMVHNEQVNLQNNNEVKQINFTNRLAAGIYQLIIISPEGKRETKQIVSE